MFSTVFRAGNKARAGGLGDEWFYQRHGGKLETTLKIDGNTRKRENTGKYREIHENTGKYPKIQGNTGKYREIHENTGKYTKIQGNTGKYGEIHENTGKYMKIQRNTGKRREIQGTAVPIWPGNT